MQEITKEGLEKLTKEELLNIFPSLELKQADKKAFIVEAILSGDPSEEEKELFNQKLAEKEAESAEEEAAPSDKPKKLVVIYPIKEDGKRFAPGDKYEGERAERFLKHGQVKEV